MSACPFSIGGMVFSDSSVYLSIMFPRNVCLWYSNFLLSFLSRLSSYANRIGIFQPKDDVIPGTQVWQLDLHFRTLDGGPRPPLARHGRSPSLLAPS